MVLYNNFLYCSTNAYPTVPVGVSQLPKGEQQGVSESIKGEEEDIQSKLTVPPNDPEAGACKQHAMPKSSVQVPFTCTCKVSTMSIAQD